MAVPLMCTAADMLGVPSRKQVVLVGDKTSAEFNDMVAAVFASYDPNRTVSVGVLSYALFPPLFLTQGGYILKLILLCSCWNKVLFLYHTAILLMLHRSL